MTSSILYGLENVQRYSTNNMLQVEDAKLLLQKYQRKIKWSEKKNIIDIGCGPGDITKDHLLHLIPTNGRITLTCAKYGVSPTFNLSLRLDGEKRSKALVLIRRTLHNLQLGIDISPSMINHAKSNNKDPRLNFEVVDFGSSSISDKYSSAFDLAVSFYCFHMIPDQRTAMKNLYNVLRSDGEALLMFATSASYFAQQQILGSNPKWSPYYHGVEDYISPYQNVIDPVSEVTNLMQDIGFKVEDCICELQNYKYPTKEIFLDSMLALNLFLKRIPYSLRDEYIEDFKQGMLSTTSDETIFSYSNIIVFARKS